MGCVQQTPEEDFNIAHKAALLAEIPYRVPATTVNCLCGSSMQALHDAARAVMVGDLHACLAGGVEHMGHVPMIHGVDFHPGLSRTVAKAAGMMGLTTKMLAHQPRAAGCLGCDSVRRLQAGNRADLQTRRRRRAETL